MKLCRWVAETPEPGGTTSRKAGRVGGSCCKGTLLEGVQVYLLGVLESTFGGAVEELDHVSAAHVAHFVNAVIPTNTIQKC